MSVFSGTVLLALLTFLPGFDLAAAAQPQQPGAPGRGPAGGASSQIRPSGNLSVLEAQAQAAEGKNNLEEASIAYRQASMAARNQGQYQKALSYGNKALDLADKVERPGIQASAILALVYAYNRVGQRDKIRELLNKGVELVKKIPPGAPKFSIEANMYRELGVDYLRGKETQKAIQYISHALEAQESLLAFFESRKARLPNPKIIRVNQRSLLLTLQRLGAAYRTAGETDTAVTVYERAVAMVNELGLTTPLESSLYEELGKLYLGRKDFDRALTNLTKGLDTAEKTHNAYVIQQASTKIGDLLRQTKKPSEAIPYYKKAIASVESSRSMLESEDLRSSFFEDKRHTYAGIILAYIGEKNWEEAFNYTERARSRAFLDILGTKVQLIQGKLLEEERALQARISTLRTKLAALQEEVGEDEEGNGPNLLRQELEEAQKLYNAFLSKLRKDNKEQASLMNVEPLTLKQAQQLLNPGVSMLEYFVVGERVLLWVVERDRLRFLSSPVDKKDLVSKVNTLRESIFQIGEKEKFTAASQDLYKLLIQPALPHIRGKELIVVPHDVLHYVPFQALLGSDNRYLIETYPIYYLSSASLMQFTQEKKRAMGERVLAFGNPDLDDPAMALQFAEIEAGELKKLYPQSTVLLKKEATEGKAKSLSPQNDIIHFASHAELNEDDPLASAIRLAKSDKEDGRLEVREIFGMDLKASLVVLSACETGLGKLSSGDELVGLTRAFIYAGTPSVVASLWNVEDSSTAQLMASFYKNLKTMTKVEALRQAQLNLIRGNVNSDLLARRGIGGIGKLGEVPAAKQAEKPLSQDSAAISTSHPFFWAPFILVGEGK